jgi:threonine aldolase
MEAYLTDGLWLRLATQANAMGARLVQGLTQIPDTGLLHPAPANMLFPLWPLGTNDRAAARGAIYYPMPAPKGQESGRLVASWSTTAEDVDAVLKALAP